MMICPQGPLETPIGPEAVGYAWYPMSMGGPLNIEAVLDSQNKLRIFLDQCMEAYPIDAKKLALLGFSQGGVMAYSLALAQPETFHCSRSAQHLAAERAAAAFKRRDAVQSLPTLVQHGTQDPTIEIDRARSSVETLRAIKTAADLP